MSELDRDRDLDADADIDIDIDIETDIAIVGAGISGLAAARSLTEAGRSVIVVDKGRTVGGRLATRRIGGATLDHGAQFFTVRADALQSMTDRALDADVVRVWTNGFSTPRDGHPRYVGSSGMTGLAKWLARDLDVRVGFHLTEIATADLGWSLRTADRCIRARQLVLTPPVPQSLALLDAGGVHLPADLDGRLRSVRYHPVLALLVTLSGPSGVPEPGGVQHEDGPFTFIGDNRQKGISATSAVTFHAAHDYSARRFEDEEGDILPELTEWARPWFGSAEPVEIQLKRWRYAGPVQPLPEATVLIEAHGSTAVLAGDAFGGPKVEGAFNSGLAAARALLEAGAR